MTIPSAETALTFVGRCAIFSLIVGTTSMAQTTSTDIVVGVIPSPRPDMSTEFAIIMFYGISPCGFSIVKEPAANRKFFGYVFGDGVSFASF
jgi:hypothetical protein